MPRPPKKKKNAVVREPVQVYLTQTDRAMLDNVAKKSGLSRAEVLRRGLRRFGAEVLEEDNPVLTFLDEMTKAEWPRDMPDDVAERHDHYLALSYRGADEPDTR